MDLSLGDGLRPSKWKEWLAGPNCSIYSCHFFASWSGRMWSFSMGLFLISVSPDSLQLTAIYGLCMGAAVLLLGPVIGDWVDKTPRLKAAIASMILQNVLVITCSLVILTLLLLLTELDHLVTWLPKLLNAVIICLTVASRLMKEARVLVVERDWIVEMCAKDEHHLAVMSSSFRRIDLLTKILAPVVTGQILTYAGLKIGCGFIAVWSLLSMGIEFYLVRRVYRIVPALRAIKLRAGYYGIETLVVNPHATEVAPLNGDNGDHKEGVLQLKEETSTVKEINHVSEDKRGTCWGWKLLASFLTLYRGFRTYFSYETKWVGLALASLYLTVLGFDGITVGYASTQGLSGSILGIMMGVGAMFGILATFTYPCIVRRLGLARTGVLALGLQVTCLTLCIVSIWLPGSPFDMANMPGEKHSALTAGCSQVNETEQTFQAANTSSLEWSAQDNKITTIERLNVSSIANVSSVGKNTTSLAVNVTSCAGNAIEPHLKSTLSVWMLITGIVLARFGLWTADLTIIQLFLERVIPTERGIVNGFQSSLNQLMNFFKFALVVVIPHTNQFGLLVLISFTFICLGWTLMTMYACKMQGKKQEQRPLHGIKGEDENTVVTTDAIQDINRKLQGEG